MFKSIVKRGGSTVPFNKEKIVKALTKAGVATGEFDEREAKKLAIESIKAAEKKIVDRDPHVEEIQDIVEQTLMRSKFKKSAKSYMIYRQQHAEMRAFATSASLGLVDSYLDRTDWQVKENSNMGYSLQGLNNYIFSEISKTYWLNKVYPERIRNAYERADLHLHDLGTLAV